MTLYIYFWVTYLFSPVFLMYVSAISDNAWKESELPATLPPIF